MGVQVGDHFVAGGIDDDGADRHAQHDVLARLAVAIRGAAVLAALGEEFARVAVVDQGVDVAVGDHDHAAALAAIATVRAALGDVFLAAERNHAVAAVAGGHVDLGFVDEFHFCALVQGRLSGKQKPYRRDRAFGVSYRLFGRGMMLHRAATLRALDGELDATFDECEQGWSLPMPTFSPGWYSVPRWRTMMLPAGTVDRRSA